MPDLSSTFLGVELRTWITGGAILLLAEVVLGWMRGVGTLSCLAWLLARIARTLEALLQPFAMHTEAGPRHESAVAG